MQQGVSGLTSTHVGQPGSRDRDSGERYYVYLHRDPNGDVFYVGKGTKDRAWRESGRHEVWCRYVEHFDGQYEVEIVQDDLNEGSAESLEDDLMREYGGQLINWFNFHRTGDWAAYEEYWSRRTANTEYVKETKTMEAADPEECVRRYRKALAEMIDYEKAALDDPTRYENYTGTAGDVYSSWFRDNACGDWLILDRLTLCLKKLGREAEIRSLVRRYLEVFPGALALSSFSRIPKRGRVK